MHKKQHIKRQERLVKASSDRSKDITQKCRDLDSLEGIPQEKTEPTEKVNIQAVIIDIQSEEDVHAQTPEPIPQEDIFPPDQHPQCPDTTPTGEPTPNESRETIPTPEPATPLSEDGQATDQEANNESPSEEDVPDQETSPEITARSCLIELVVIALSVLLVFGGAVIFYLVMAITYAQPAHPQMSSAIMAPPPTSTTHPTPTTEASTTTTSTTTTSTMRTVICQRPYMRFGLGCCLDTDGNGICDLDETPSTTLSDYVICHRDSDCGPTRVEYACRMGDVHRITIDNTCIRAGEPGSACDRSVLDELVDACGQLEHCVGGKQKCQQSWGPGTFDY